MSCDLGFESTNNPNYYFLSYNREDAARVREIARLLPEAGIDVWYDKNINPGENWETIIAAKIRHCQAVILFFTKGILSKEDSFVVKEYRVAKMHKPPKRIICIIMDDIDSDDVPVHKDFWYDGIVREQGIIAYGKSNPEIIVKELSASLAEIEKNDSCSVQIDTVDRRLNKKVTPRFYLKRKTLQHISSFLVMVLMINTVHIQLGYSVFTDKSIVSSSSGQDMEQPDSDSSNKPNSDPTEDESLESSDDTLREDSTPVVSEESTDQTTSLNDTEGAAGDESSQNDTGADIGHTSSQNSEEDTTEHTPSNVDSYDQNGSSSSTLDSDNRQIKRVQSNDGQNNDDSRTTAQDPNKMTDSRNLLENPDNDKDSIDNTESEPSIVEPAEPVYSVSSDSPAEVTESPANVVGSPDSTDPDNLVDESLSNPIQEEDVIISLDDMSNDDPNTFVGSSSDEMKDYVGENGAAVKRITEELGLTVEFRTEDDQIIQPDYNLDDTIVCRQSIDVGKKIIPEDLPIIFWITLQSDSAQTETE